MIRTILILLFPLFAASQDSLYSTELPAVKDAAASAVTVGQSITTAGGTITSIRFWKNENGNTAYKITLWDSATGASLFSTLYKSTALGWQRITLTLPVTAGTYIVGVYYPAGKYVYTNGLNPRTRGRLTGTSGLFAGGDSRPGGKYTAGFFVDISVSYPVLVPLSVRCSPDRDEQVPKDTVGVQGFVQGGSFRWSVEDSQGAFELKDTNTLRPYVILKDSIGCRVWLMLTGTSPAGDQLADVVAIRVAPARKLVVGYILFDGTIVWRTPPTYIELPGK